jgi:hypothetical protein
MKLSPKQRKWLVTICRLAVPAPMGQAATQRELYARRLFEVGFALWVIGLLVNTYSDSPGFGRVDKLLFLLGWGSCTGSFVLRPTVVSGFFMLVGLQIFLR